MDTFSYTIGVLYFGLFIINFGLYLKSIHDKYSRSHNRWAEVDLS